MPYAESDFIVASIGEELGLTGVIAIVLLYGLLVERALRAALVCRDGFGKLVASASPASSRCRSSWSSAASPG